MISRNDLLFALSAEQAADADLDPERQWFGVLALRDGERVSHLTCDTVVFELMRLCVETETEPPVEFADWANEQVVSVLGSPNDW